MYGGKKIFSYDISSSKLIGVVIIFCFSFFNLLRAQSIDKDSLLHQYNSAGELTYSKENINLLNGLAKKYRFRNPDSLMFFTKKLLAISHNSNDINGIALGKMREGDYHSDIGNHKSALLKYFEAQELLNDTDKPRLQSELCTQLAIQYFFMGQLKKALESAYLGIDISLQKKLIWNEARIRHVLGFIYTQNKLYKEAEEELSKAIDLWEKTGDSLSLYGSRSNLARNSVLSGNIEKSKKYFEGNIDFFAKSNELLWLARSYMVQSHIKLEENNLQQALKSNKKYDSVLRKLKNPRDRILTYNLFSRIYFLTKAYDNAKQYADSTIYCAQKLKDSVELLNAYELLSKMAVENTNYEEAVKYSSLALPIKEVLDKRFTEDNLKLLRTKLELEYEQLEKEMEDDKKLMRQRRITAIALLLLAILIGLSLLWRKILQKRKSVNDELQDLNQTKNKLFSIIGHDLQAPIGALQELLELYNAHTISSNKISRVLPKLKQNVDRSAFTLNNLLFWAKTQMNGLKPNPKKVLVKQKAHTICEMYRSRSDKKNISIECNIAKNLLLYVDAFQLEIILRNIISNAIKFTPEGGNIVLNSIEGNNVVEISVCDDGVGMNALTVDHLLKGGHIEPRQGTHGEKGTGLGILISKELIELNRGQLKIDSRIGEGSCVRIAFPLDQKGNHR